MNKNEFIDAIYNQSGLSKKDCKLCLETIFEVIKCALQSGESVAFSNFGKFKVNDKKEKVMYNFKTKNIEIVKPKRTLSFKPSENLKQIVK